MRLTQKERTSIRDAVAFYDDSAKVSLFGSRLQDDARGGDIDLLVVSTSLTESDKRKIKLRIYDAVGEQKIDLILIHPDEPKTAFVKQALQEGVQV